MKARLEFALAFAKFDCIRRKSGQAHTSNFNVRGLPHDVIQSSKMQLLKRLSLAQVQLSTVTHVATKQLYSKCKAGNISKQSSALTELQLTLTRFPFYSILAFAIQIIDLFISHACTAIAIL